MGGNVTSSQGICITTNEKYEIFFLIMGHFRITFRFQVTFYFQKKDPYPLKIDATNNGPST